MEIITEKENQKMNLIIKGKIDTITAPMMQEQIDKLIELKEKHFVLDFKEVKYLSSLGIRVILSEYKKLNKLQGNIELINVSDMVYEVLEMTGFTDVIKVK